MLICASPTRWDEEARLGGTHSLPLTEAGALAIHALVEKIEHAVHAVYTFKRNQGCEQAARFEQLKRRDAFHDSLRFLFGFDAGAEVLSVDESDVEPAVAEEMIDGVVAR